jgi:hypothetical protein
LEHHSVTKKNGLIAVSVGAIKKGQEALASQLFQYLQSTQFQKERLLATGCL